jgi:NADH-quinone oxidoreductase subunit F/NADP-reducing hydrogenase subunit HndC
MKSIEELPRLKSAEELEALKLKVLPRIAIRKDPAAKPYNDVTHHIMICCDTGCASSGARAIVEAFTKELAAREMERTVDIVVIGCHGFCEMGPLLVIYPDDVYYIRLRPDDVGEIIDETIINHRPVPKLLYHDRESLRPIVRYNEIEFYAKQNRVLLANCGQINPEDVEEYVANDGYKALAKALSRRDDPLSLLEEVKKSGLRGRGGGGFPTALKWELCRQAEGEEKFIICNADEGDPGAFMDRSLMEGDPHRLLEGMVIGALIIGAQEGYIYVRAEYPVAVKRLKNAIAQAEAMGFLGDNILGSDWSFRIYVREGAGAFVCGEETALIHSIEGKRGMPTPRPPFPAISGLWGMPTNNNNVETWANIPGIILNGGDWFASYGTEKSKGTKVFALTGKIRNTGLAEVSMGLTMREIIYDIGGGIQNNKKFKAVQIGGPSGGCLPESMIDRPVDYDSLIEAGAMMGSGGLVVVDEDTCMVALAQFFLTFTRDESCGKCTPCREGTTRMLNILNNIVKGKGKAGDIELLEELARNIKLSALCGLGQTSANPILSTLNYFREEYKAHIYEKRCPAHHCIDLITYWIDADKCIGCGACRKKCPVQAIDGAPKKPHTIDISKCIKCGACFGACRKNQAIFKK